VKRVHVALPHRPYDVVVGEGALGELGGLLADRRRVAVVSQSTVASLHADPVCRTAPGSELFLIPEGESAKTLTTAETLCRRFASWGLPRDGAVVALGGGVVGDVAGFAASVYARGVDIVQIPTTLLAMVDAAIGGKTGVNLPEGKNLIGAFHQPIGVLADLATLRTLPDRQYRAGLAEVAKYGLLGAAGSDAILERLERDAGAVLARDEGALTELIARCAAIKAAVVAADPEERTGLRATLNYGHTLAHALESAGHYDLLHGEAVAIGLVFAAALAEALERIEPARRDRHRDLVAALGLPAQAPDGVTADRLLELMRRDKKARGGLMFVLAGPHGLEPVEDPPAAALALAFEAIGISG